MLISIPAFFGFTYAGWGEAGLPPFSTGFVNWIAFAVIFPIAMLVTPYGAQLEMGFALFLLFVSVRFFWTLVG